MTVRLARNDGWVDVELPANKDHFRKLIDFAVEILGVCDQLRIAPTLSGSLAVLAHTGRSDIAVHDIDLACSEADFPRLQAALSERRIDTRIKPWHVLQARRGDVKVEFDAAEHWMTGLSTDYRSLDLGGTAVRVVGLDDLRELYRRGVEELQGRDDEPGRAKLAHVRSRYDMLAGA